MGETINTGLLVTVAVFVLAVIFGFFLWADAKKQLRVKKRLQQPLALLCRHQLSKSNRSRTHGKRVLSASKVLPASQNLEVKD